MDGEESKAIYNDDQFSVYCTQVECQGRPSRVSWRRWCLVVMWQTDRDWGILTSVSSSLWSIMAVIAGDCLQLPEDGRLRVKVHIRIRPIRKWDRICVVAEDYVPFFIQKHYIFTLNTSSSKYASILLTFFLIWVKVSRKSSVTSVHLNEMIRAELPNTAQRGGQ